MNERVRHKLSEIVQRYGREICREPKRCKGLLLDHCAGDRREVFVLVSALEEQVVADLVEGPGGQSWGLVSSRLVRRLVEHRAMAEDAALWAVESWALALGVISGTEPIAKRRARHDRGTKPHAVPKMPDDSEAAARSVSGLSHVNAADVMTSRAGQIRLKLIPPGEFRMGSLDSDSEAYDDEKPQHKVRISRAFYLGVTPVTQAQYEAVMGKNPSYFQRRPDHPVESVTWFEALEFCNSLSRKESLPTYYLVGRGKSVQVCGGAGYRLPTEAEWEFACRAGSEKRYCFGDNRRGLAKFASYWRNPGGVTCSVGQNSPNALGLYDMHGNVWEWCWDGYDGSYYRRSPDVDPSGMEEATHKVVRGGGWNDDAIDVRSACRLRFSPEALFRILGFRVARGTPTLRRGPRSH